MRCWEYLVDPELRGMDAGELEHELDLWGSKGWELVGMAKAGWVFKRKLRREKDDS